MLAVNVSVGETAEDGERLVSSAKGFYARLSRVGAAAMVPMADEAMQEMRDDQCAKDQCAEPTASVDGVWPRFIAGDPQQVKATLARSCVLKPGGPMQVATAPRRPTFEEMPREAEQAFDEALVECSRSLRAYGRSLCGSQHAAEDLVQETLLKAWRARARFTPGTNLQAWTRTILRNLFLKRAPAQPVHW